MRDGFFVAFLMVAVAAGQAPAPPSSAPAPQTGARAKPFDVFEASIPDMQAAMKSGRTTSAQIVQQYLTRIAKYEDLLHAAITVNPNALEEAAARDRERAQGRVRGPLHGIPIALKDNVHTTNMRTTGGALAFESRKRIRFPWTNSGCWWRHASETWSRRSPLGRER